MSGSSKKPDIHPTFPTKNPTFRCRKGANATTLLIILTILKIPAPPLLDERARPANSTRILSVDD